MHAFSEPTTNISMKIDPYNQWQRCSSVTVVSGNIRFIGHSWGFLGGEASKNSGVIENGDFWGFQMLRLLHLRK